MNREHEIIIALENHADVMSGCTFLPKNKNRTSEAVYDYTYSKPVKITIVVLIVIACYVATGIIHASAYEKDVYVCRHMARDLEDTLETIGLEVKLVSGKKTQEKTGHLWISVYGLEIDSVTLMPMSLLNEKYDNISTYDDYRTWAEDHYKPETYHEMLMKGEL